MFVLLATIDVFTVFMYRNDAFWFRLIELNVDVGAVETSVFELIFTRFDTKDVFSVFMYKKDTFLV
jgi:hypothetical protein